MAFFVVTVPCLWHSQWHFPDLHSCIATYLSWQLLGSGLIALSYADVNTVQRHSWNNSCSPLPFLPLQLALHLHYWLSPTSSTCLIWRLACCKVGWDCSHCMQRSWLASDKRPQLPNERQLHHCLHVTDGWQCWQTGGINWRGYQGRARLHFRASLFFLFTLVLSASRCIFIQMQGEDESERPLAECTCFFRVILMQSICAYPLCVCTQKIVLYILLGCGVGQNRYAQRKWHELK